MRIRLHLVRFMYINLILSCCFWLYDNAAAADEFSAVNAAAAAAVQNADAAGVVREPGLHTLDPDKGDSNEKVPNVLNEYTKSKEVASEEEAPATTTTTTAETETTTRQEVDSVVLKLGKAPRTSAKTKATTTETETTQSSDVKDTSVNLSSSNVNINNNNNRNSNQNEPISVVPLSERNNNNNYNNDNDNDNVKAASDAATAKVPKNQLNNKINHNIYTNTNTNEDVYQSEQSQQTAFIDDVIIPKTVPLQQQQQQREQQQQQPESFPEIITELPSVTVTELPLQLEPVKETLDAVILQETSARTSNKSVKEQEEDQTPLGDKKIEQKDDINDPGGGFEFDGMSTTESNATVDANLTSNEGLSAEAEVSLGSNETVEEVPMPVFSEWAQKQMEAEASREQAMELEQQVVNNSAQRRNATGTGNGKLPSLKLRAKNYASPDCGAKIIASNADATNTGAVLSHSSDEYMLSTCGSRIWFVVELCEAVQAQKVELANFELFSSSPRNFTVAVSKRFPTRDWSNVGRFAAEDKRTVQTFELHPHLFGKFVRVDIHSHYSKEHFCPISLFRVFGTSEYEAFETETRHSDELDDFDDDFAGQEQTHKASSAGNGNIFQSASDAVMQMVKKAAQVLVKPTKALRWSTDPVLCHTPAAGVYSCSKCNSTIVERINNLLSCQSQQLQLLLSLPQLRQHLLLTRVCQNEYDIGLSLGRIEVDNTSGMDKRQSFYLSILPVEHVGAMCKMLQAELSTSIVQPVAQLQHWEQLHLDVVEPSNTENNTASAAASVETVGENLMPNQLPNESLLEFTDKLENLSQEASNVNQVAPTIASNASPAAEQPTAATTVAPTPADVNIFNVASETQDSSTSGTPEPTLLTPVAATEASEVEATLPSPPTNPVLSPPTTTTDSNGDLLGSGNGLDESNLANWENIDSLLTTTVASITAGGGAAAAAAAVVNGNAHLGGTANLPPGGGINLQPKLTHGAQSESVFIRLSNRIKALERNMSLSGQYLEELSRRYKKQVEELQQTLTQQTLTVRTLEDQSRRYVEQEQLYIQQSAELAGEVRALTYQVQACILVVIIVGSCIFLMLVLGTVYYRKLRRQTQQLNPPQQPSSSVAIKQQLSRRKSYEQLVEPAAAEKRRPSEEAMLIMNNCGDISVVAPTEVTNVSSRQRKVSVCYGSNNNIAASMFNSRASLHRRKGCKHSSLDSAQLNSATGEQFFDVETLKSSKLPPKVPKKKSQQLQQAQQQLKRQESAPGNFTQGSQLEESNTQSDFDESLILDDDDLCNFIPNSDLAYNEFMPEGPSGYQIVDTVDGVKAEKPQNVKKSRRVSSPAFFKSPFSKSKNKGGTFNGIGGVKGSHSAHEATSWEWYRLKRNEKQAKQLTTPPSASLDSCSSLSEISFPYNATQNSFRILGEAIRSASEESSRVANGNSNGNGKTPTTLTVGSSSSSGASTTSSTTKKKQRAFNNIFRKVF